MSSQSVAPSAFFVPGGVLAEVIDGETVLLHLDSGRYFGLNRTGTRIWQLLTERMDESAASAIIATEFAVDEQTARRDISSLVKELTERGLLARGSA